MPTPATAADDDLRSADRPRRARAAALSPEDRRAAIVEAVVPLLIREGPAVSTRQIADAAGIAEGTIFRVFTDKQAVIDAVVETVLDPARALEALAAVPADGPLEARLAAAVEAIQRRVDVVWRLMTAVDMTKPLAQRRRDRGANAPEIRALAELIAPDADRLRVDPMEAAQRLRSLTFACTHPALVDTPATPTDVVALLLDGIRSR